LHQPFRASFVPGLNEMLVLDVPGLIGVALSGAGPSVLALAEAGSLAGERVREVFARHGVTARVHDLAPAERGIVREG
jgi:homoserine kinase